MGEPKRGMGGFGKANRECPCFPARLVAAKTPSNIVAANTGWEAKEGRAAEVQE